VILTSTGVLFGCSGDEQPAIETAAPAPARGAELLKPFKKELMHALQASIESGGPLEAMTVCNLEAPMIAESNSTEGVRVGRSSHKLRNPTNAPSAWVKPVLDAYVSDPEQRKPRTIELGDNRLGYIEPIYVKPMCLPCHGREISEDVAAKLAELYPDDAATGFAAGEFRGVFWVEYPAN